MLLNGGAHVALSIACTPSGTDPESCVIENDLEVAPSTRYSISTSPDPPATSSLAYTSSAARARRVFASFYLPGLTTIEPAGDFNGDGFDDFVVWDPDRFALVYGHPG